MKWVTPSEIAYEKEIETQVGHQGILFIAYRNMTVSEAPVSPPADPIRCVPYALSIMRLILCIETGYSSRDVRRF